MSQIFSGYTIEMWPIDDVVEYARNARQITDAAVDKVAASIQEFGFRQPIVVDKEGVIVVGHVRRRAAKKLGMAEVPVHVADNLTPAQIKAYRLMDNRSHDEVKWDLDLLGPELGELQEMGFDLGLTGFELGEIGELLREPGLTAEDAAPELPERATSRFGDVWLLEPHRVLCGDATSIEHVSRLLGGQQPPLLMVTDAPYGVGLEPEWREEAGLNPRTRQGGKVSNDNRADWSAAYKLFPGDVAYLWHAGIYAGAVAASLESFQFQIRAQIIWKKQHFAISRGAYHWSHEPCWYAVRTGKTAHWRGDRTQSTVWEVANLNSFGGHSDGENSDGENKATGHGTQKPVELMRRPIVNHTVEGQAVYDPFLGSGTTVIAAETTGRICYGLEIDPRYVDVIVERWQNFTGKQAKIEGIGVTYAQAKCDRLRRN